MTVKNAILTGVLGQTGSYLAEILIAKGYDVYGVYRRVSTGNNMGNLSEILSHPQLHLIESDICDHVAMATLVKQVQPEIMFNLAASSHVGHSFKTPTECFRINAEAVIAQLDILRNFSSHTRYYQASTSELCGGYNAPEEGYDESFVMNPQSPYSVAKAAAYYAVRNYRTAYGLYATNGVLFNHESPRRGTSFFTRKLTYEISRIKLGLQSQISLGNLDACRDIGHAKDYAMAQYMILTQDQPEDFVVASGEAIPLKDMLNYVCELAELDPDKIVVIDDTLKRPSEVPFLKGNSAKIRGIGWQPTYTWRQILAEMYKHDLASNKIS